jgi:hypothetical protein
MDPVALLYRIWTSYSTGWGLLVSIGMYIWFVLCLAAIARKSRLGMWWLSPLPVANFALMCSLGKRSSRCFWAFTLPFVALVVGLAVWLPLWTLGWLVVWSVTWAAAWTGIARERGKPAALGLLILVPVVNLALLGVLAFGE